MKHLISLILFAAAIHAKAQNTPCTAINMTGLFGAGSASCSGGGSVAQTITPSGMTNGFETNGGGITGLNNNCVGGSIAATSQDYWYTFTAPTNMGSTIIDVSSAGGGLANPELQLYSATGTCPNLTMTSITCGTTTGSFTPVAGTKYYVRIFGEASTIPAMGKFTLCARTTPTNDLCTNAIPLTSGATVCGGNLGAVLNGASTTGGCSTDQDVWYKFTTGSTVNCYSWQESQISSSGGCTDNVLAVYTGCSGTGSGTGYIGYNGTSNTFNDMSTADLTTALLPNTTYYIQVASDVNQTFCLKFTANTPTAANDQCSNPVGINSTPNVTDNAVAGCEYTYVPAQDANIVASSICASTLENVSWFNLIAQSTGSQITITFANITCNNGGGGFQTGIFTGTSCSALTPLVAPPGNCVSGASGTVTYTIPAASVVAGNQYWIAMDGVAGSNCHFTVSGTNLTPLPVELINFFVVRSSHRNVELAWNTATEKDNDYFTIQRSEDGFNWTTIGTIDGAGNSTSPSFYSFADSNPRIGVSYYRLIQTDFDGVSTNPGTLSVQITEYDNFDVEVFPNPSSENESVFMEFSGKQNERMQFSIYDSKGMLLSGNFVEMQGQTTTISINETFSKGIYFLKCTNSAGESITKRFAVN